MFDNPHLRAMLDLGCKSGLRGPQHIHAGTQAQHVERIHDEGPMATLGTALAADQPLTSALRRLSERLVHDLHQ
jgi:hypothetical protein